MKEKLFELIMLWVSTSDYSANAKERQLVEVLKVRQKLIKNFGILTSIRLCEEMALRYLPQKAWEYLLNEGHGKIYIQELDRLWGEKNRIKAEDEEDKKILIRDLTDLRGLILNVKKFFEYKGCEYLGVLRALVMPITR